MSVDDMLWWLYDTYKIVVGTRTIRRVFERKGEAGNRFKGSKGKQSNANVDGAQDHDDNQDSQSPVQAMNAQYQSPYAPMPAMTPQQNTANQAEMHLAQALSNATYPPPPNLDMDNDLPDDEETLQLQLQQVELQRREVELKLRMRRLQQGKSPHTPGQKRKSTASTPSSLYNPSASNAPTQPKRDSRSKKKQEESRKRTAERQERMLRDLERRSRRREHLTAEWVQSKDIWPLRAQGMLADLMHQYGCYTFSQNNVDTFEAMYRDLYQLVDHTKGDWDPNVHDEMLRERTKRKMGQLRTKMQKTGEIIGRPDAYGGSIWQKADNYTGEQAGQDLNLGADDENDHSISHEAELEHQLQQHQHDSVHDPALQAQAQAGAMQPPEEHMHYEPHVPDPINSQQAMQHAQPIYGNPPMMHHQQAPPYPMMVNEHGHPGMMPYAQMPPQPGHDGGMMM